jgi:hypothetical protein
VRTSEGRSGILANHSRGRQRSTPAWSLGGHQRSNSAPSAHSVEGVELTGKDAKKRSSGIMLGLWHNPPPFSWAGRVPPDPSLGDGPSNFGAIFFGVALWGMGPEKPPSGIWRPSRQMPSLGGGLEFRGYLFFGWPSGAWARKNPIWNLAPPRGRCPRSAGVSKLGAIFFGWPLGHRPRKNPTWNLAPLKQTPRSAAALEFRGYLGLDGLLGSAWKSLVWNLPAPRGRPLARGGPSNFGAIFLWPVRAAPRRFSFPDSRKFRRSPAPTLDRE